MEITFFSSRWTSSALRLQQPLEAGAWLKHPMSPLKGSRPGSWREQLWLQGDATHRELLFCMSGDCWSRTRFYSLSTNFCDSASWCASAPHPIQTPSKLILTFVYFLGLFFFFFWRAYYDQNILSMAGCRNFQKERRRTQTDCVLWPRVLHPCLANYWLGLVFVKFRLPSALPARSG